MSISGAKALGFSAVAGAGAAAAHAVRLEKKHMVESLRSHVAAHDKTEKVTFEDDENVGDAEGAPKAQRENSRRKTTFDEPPPQDGETQDDQSYIEPEKVDEILKGLSVEDPWTTPKIERAAMYSPRPKRPTESLAQHRLAQMMRKRAEMFEPVKSMFTNAERLPDFDDIAPKEARKVMQRRGYFRFQPTSWNILWGRWKKARAKRKENTLWELNAARELDRKRPVKPAADVKNIADDLLKSMKSTFPSETWEHVGERVNPRTGITKETKKHVETIALETRDSIFGDKASGLQKWEAMEVEISDEDKMLRALAKSMGVAVVDAEAIYKEFKEFDTDDSGTMDASEFKAMMVKMHGGHEPTPTQLKNALASIDEDGNGEIDFAEFFVWYSMNYLADIYR